MWTFLKIPADLEFDEALPESRDPSDGQVTHGILHLTPVQSACPSLSGHGVCFVNTKPITSRQTFDSIQFQIFDRQFR